MSLTAEAAVFLRAQGIDSNGGGVGRGRRSRGISYDNGGVGGGRGIDNASEGSETTTEAAVDRRRARVIYDDDGGVRGGR